MSNEDLVSFVNRCSLPSNRVFVKVVEDAKDLVAQTTLHEAIELWSAPNGRTELRVSKQVVDDAMASAPLRTAGDESAAYKTHVRSAVQ